MCRKHQPWKELFDLAILRITSVGLTEKFLRVDLLFNPKRNPFMEIENRNQAHDIDSFLALFMSLSYGLGLGVIIMMVEKFLDRDEEYL